MTYVFGDCELDCARMELRRAGRASAVEPKAFDLLHFLLRNRDRLVVKDELIEQVWQGRVVSDAALSRCLRLARQAIGDTGRRQRWIRTVARRGFRFVGDVELRVPHGDAIVHGEAPEPVALGKPAIAVLPFANLSGDPQEFFCDGITDDIITELSRTRSLSVIARSSSFSYKHRDAEVAQVARELGVRYIVEGSVQKVAQRVRVYAQLVDAATGDHLWAERYDRDLVDIFDLQDEIAGIITGAIQRDLRMAEVRRSGRTPVTSLGAWEHYQLGQFHMWQMTSEGASLAEMHYLRAIELDPEFSSAYAWLADLLRMNVLFGRVEGREETLQRALAAAERAVQCNDDDPLAHYALGRISTVVGDHDAAVAELRLALELSPNLATAHLGLGFALHWAGRAEEAMPHLQRFFRLSPREPGLWAPQALAGSVLRAMGDYEGALEWLRRSAIHPNANHLPFIIMASSLIRLMRIAEAKAAIAEALRRTPGMTVEKFRDSVFACCDAYKLPLLDDLRKAGLPE